MVHLSIIQYIIIIHIHYYNDSRIRLTDNRIRLLQIVATSIRGKNPYASISKHEHLVCNTLFLTPWY